MHNDDELSARTYQDDFDSDDAATDPIIDEETDDPIELFSVPPEEFKHEMDIRAIDDMNIHDESEDMREAIEDADDA